MSQSLPRMYPLHDLDAKVVPCPFCGGDAMTLETVPDPCILCLACGARGPLSVSPEEAVALWNACTVDETPPA